MLSNLVGNAVKFTPPNGHLRVSVTAIEDDYEVRVSDNGPGMDAETAAHLGERYYRGKSTRAPGTGLGLMIVKEILDAHATTLQVQTQPGGGSSFSFRLRKV